MNTTQIPPDVDAYWREAWTSDTPAVQCFREAVGRWPQRSVPADASAVLANMTRQVAQRVGLS